MAGEPPRSFTVYRRRRLRALPFCVGAFLSVSAELRAQAWGRHFDTATKIVDVYIRYLRRKVDGDSETPLIHTVRGFGYTLSQEAPCAPPPLPS